jgi:hypothetical protein
MPVLANHHHARSGKERNDGDGAGMMDHLAHRPPPIGQRHLVYGQAQQFALERGARGD